MRSVIKTRQDYELANQAGVFYDVVFVENKLELSWLSKPTIVYDKNQIGQWCDWSLDAIYIDNKTGLPCLIRLGMICDEN